MPSANKLNTPKPWKLLAPAIFVLAWGGNHFTPLLHMYMELGNYAPWQVNMLLATYVAGLVPGLLVASNLSDSFGRKPVVLVSLGLSILASVVLAASLHTYWLLCIGRALAGIGVGVAMSVGSTWMKEISQGRFDPEATFATGAKRSSLSVTLGFGIGAGITGVLAQWAPLPSVLPYALHIALTVAAILILAKSPESVNHKKPLSGWWRVFDVSCVKNPAFKKLVLPAAPWVFAAASVSYAIVPTAMESRLGDMTTIYAAGLTIITLGVGAIVQPYVPALNQKTGGRALVVGLGLLTAGMLVAAAAVARIDPILGCVVCVILGAAFGITVMAGLLKIQEIAPPEELAGITGIYYSITYIGFLLPTVLALFLPWWSYSASLLGVAALTMCSLLVVAVNTKANKS